MKKANLNPQRLAIGGLAFVGVLVAVIGFLAVVKPQQSKSTQLDAQIAQAQAQYAALHSSGSRTPQLHAIALFQLSRAMPDTDDMPGILFALSRLAGGSGVSLTSVVPQPHVTLTDGSSALPINVTVNGTWTQVNAFVRGIDQQVKTRGNSYSVAGRLFDIDNFHLQPGDKPTVVTATLALTAFDYGAPPAATATLGSAVGSTTTGTTTTTSSGTQQAAGAPAGS